MSRSERSGTHGGSTGAAVPVLAALVLVLWLAVIFLRPVVWLPALGVVITAGLFVAAIVSFKRERWIEPAVQLPAEPARGDIEPEPAAPTPAYQQADATEALCEVGTCVAEGASADELLARVHMALRRVIEFECFAVIVPEQGQAGSVRVFRDGGDAVDTRSLTEAWGTLIDQVMHGGQPVNLSEDPATENVAQFWLGIPIVVEGQVRGLMALTRDKPAAFGDRERGLLQAIAGPVAMALQQTELKAERFRRVEQLASLGQISEMIASEDDLDKTLHAIMEQVNLVFNVEAGSLLLVEGDRLKFRVAVGAKAEGVKPFSLHIGQGIAGWVAQTGQPLLVRDAKSDSRHFGQIDRETEFATRSILCVPMERKGRVIGVIEIINPLDGRLFDDDDLRLLESVANSALIAIENAVLHSQTERRLAEVLTLYTLAKQVTSTLDLNTVLNSVVRIIKEVFTCRASCIFLLDEATRQLEIKAAYGVSTNWIREAKMTLGEGISGKVAVEGTPIYVRDTERYPGFLYFDHNVRSLMVVPLMMKGRVVGTLCVDDSKPDAFTNSDERLLTIAAAQASVAIENARLYQGLKERAERLERAYEELKEVNRLKTELVQNVSHELRTPLTFVKGYVELLLDSAMGDLNPAQLDALKVVAGRTDAVIRLVSDIITLQKTEMGQFAFLPSDVTEILHQAIAGARVASERGGIGVELVTQDPLPEVMADRGRILQVLDNLIANAIKFSPNGGTVTVRAEANDDRVLISVEDHGIGIPEDKAGKVFERFYQADGSMTRRYGGAGLGLAIVKQIVEAHGGRVWLKSAVGKGSIFFFTVPAVPNDRACDAAGGPESPQGTE